MPVLWHIRQGDQQEYWSRERGGALPMPGVGLLT
jgi:hypothetical protein